MLSTVRVCCLLGPLGGKQVAFVGKIFSFGYLGPWARQGAAVALLAAAGIDGFVAAADRDYDSWAEQPAGSF